MPRLTRLRDLEPRLPRVKSSVLTSQPFVLLDATNTTTEFGARWLVTIAFAATYPEGTPRHNDLGVGIPNRYVALLGRSESRDRLTRHFASGGAPLGPVILQEVSTREHRNRFFELVDWDGEPDPLLMAQAGIFDDDGPPDRDDRREGDDELADAF